MFGAITGANNLYRRKMGNKMKAKFYFYISITCVLSFASCDDFLDKEPVDQISSEELFTSEQNARAAVAALYRSLGSGNYYGQAFVVVPEFAAGHPRHTANFPEYLEYEENRIRVDNPWSLNIWTVLYSTINAANNVITNVPTMENLSSTNVRDQLVQEARFVRALSYFNLVRSFGDVPLLLQPTTSAAAENIQVPRSPASVVYESIVSDLLDATNLPNAYTTLQETKGRATGNAARALLARVFLYQGNYAEAANYAQQVINSGLTLTSDYASIWESENSSESIFEIQFDDQFGNTLVANATPAGTTLFFASEEAFTLFDPNDQRRDFTVLQTNGNYYIGKYRNFNPPSQNFVVLRLSEMYLIYAEAAARTKEVVTQEAYNYFKAIRDRARLETLEITSYSVDSFIAAVQREKRLELMFEAEAWYDYTRTGLALTEMMTVPDPERYVFPIPQLEVNLNRQLTQNGAYD